LSIVFSINASFGYRLAEKTVDREEMNKNKGKRNWPPILQNIVTVMHPDLM